jgi:hypothetical protein
MLVQDMKVQLIRPPITVRSAAASHLPAGLACHRTLAFIAHTTGSFRYAWSVLHPDVARYSKSVVADAISQNQLLIYTISIHFPNVYKSRLITRQ